MVHYTILDGGDQPNVVPPEATVWYYLRAPEYPAIKKLHDLGHRMAGAAAVMTDTKVSHRIVGSAWPVHFNKTIAEVQQRNIERVGMPRWSEADQTLARAIQKEVGVKVEGLKLEVEKVGGPLQDPNPGSDDIGDISWNVPTTYLRFPANVPHIPRHHWSSGVAMATPIAHQGSTAGAKAMAATALDFLLSPALVREAWDYFRDVQTKEIKYEPLIQATDRPTVEMNLERMEKFLPRLRKLYYDPERHATYLDQLGISYPTLRMKPQ